jgi:transposase InsO family protein
LGLVQLSVVEQRYRVVVAVLGGAAVSEVAVEAGVCRQSVYTWLWLYREGGLAGLSDRSHRPRSCPHQCAAEVEALVCELRRAHPGWGALRIRHELQRGNKLPSGAELPSRASVNRILHRHGLIEEGRRRKKRSEYVRWQRERAMQLWQIDILLGPGIVDLATGELREARIVTGVDDHSRYCVIAKMVDRATGRAVCLAFADALGRHGVPEEVLTDNGKQFTGRFGAGGGEVLFDRICRRNGIAHRLTQPRSPTTTGKVERFHQTMRREWLDQAGPFMSVAEAQAALDAWVSEYNERRPHQALAGDSPVTPSERFQSTDAQERELLAVWQPGALAAVSDPGARVERSVDREERGEDVEVEAASVPRDLAAGMVGGPVEFDRVVPVSGNLWAMGRQFWLGPSRAGQTVRFWAGVDTIHLSIGGARVKSLRSHLGAADLERLRRDGAVGAGPPPLPAVHAGSGAVEVDRSVSSSGIVSLAGRQVLAAEILQGRRVSIRVDVSVLMFFDPDTRELLRTRPNPLSAEQIRGLRGARPAGPTPRPSTEPVTVRRRASATGVFTVCGQKVSLGRPHAGQTITVHVSQDTLAVELDDETLTIARTTSRPAWQLKPHRPHRRAAAR